MVHAGRTMARVVRRLWRGIGPAGATGHVATPDDIENCYLYLLRRDPDAGGLAYWRERVQSQRLGLRELWNGFIDSPECQNLKRSMLGRKSGGRERFWCMETEGFRIYLDS